MITKLTEVTKFLSFIIRRFFITTNVYIKITLKIIQLTVDVYNEKLNYIKKIFVTLKEKILITRGLASSVIN